MLSRGRHANHAYVQVTGDGDPHTQFNPDSIAPPTPTERLEDILSRSDVPASATTQVAALRDPRTLLGAAVSCYQDSIVVAAEQHAGPELIQRLEEAATGLGLTDADAWPVLLSRLLVINANGYDPVSALVDFASAEGVKDARDPAAAIDHRLDIVGLREAPERRPLPWLPAIPEKLAGAPEWSTYLGARFELVTRLAAEVRSEAETLETVPSWAGALVHPPTPEVVAHIELWRAAHQITDNDLRPSGPVQHHIVEARAQHRLDALIAGESEAVVNWLGLIHRAAPATVEDPATIRVARECAEADPDGSWLPQHVQQEARRPLPDDHKADALRYRLEKWLHPVWETVTAKQMPLHDPRHDRPRPIDHHRSRGIGI